MPIRQNDFLLVEEIAQECRAPRTTVRQWMHTGRLPSIRLGRRRLVRREHFERFLRNAGLADALPERTGQGQEEAAR
jgi:excisionase family DNA binding protein